MKLFKPTQSKIDIIEKAEMYIYLAFIFGALIGFTMGLFL